MALVDARRDRDPQRALALGPALAVARLARRLDDLPLAVAAGARRDVDHLAEHRLADRPDLALAVALRALGRGACPALAPVPSHVSQRPRTGNSISFSVPLTASANVIRMSYRRSEPVCGRAARRLAASRRPAEEGIEDVGEAAEAGRVEAFGAARARDAGLAEHVVRLAPLGVGEDLVGLVDLLEPLLGGRVRVDVGMPLLGELAEGALDRGVVGSPLDAEHLVVVALTDHGRLRVYGTLASRPGQALARSRRRTTAISRSVFGR